ncbi:MAG: DNA mismatch repair endonuclease MutL [Lachnospiraceae bacterium]|nr:DNA mismatch repair endonuclease MutL [Lachnospiraceae bacterium]
MINILDEKTINRIAAGEVVERPVSVVKELVENAIDSGAKNISVEIKGGGIDLIRVTDNGCGIEKNSIPLAFLRHATSKIKDADDLCTIHTLGFRGEALSSIAAVSRVEMMSKRPKDVLGYCYRIEGGREASFDEAGIPDGTTIIVRNLFFNTPARKKFLKSAMTEGNQITSIMEKIVLSHPDIAFKYTVNGALKLSSDGLGDIRSDVYAVFGRDITRSLCDISLDNGKVSITGYAGKPVTARGNRDCEIFFVNGRYVKSSVLSSAAEEAYKPFLMLHRFPFLIMYFRIASELLDVNVHPAKTEIRFSDEKEIYDLVKDAVYQAITRQELIVDAAPEAIEKNAEPEEDKPTVSAKPENIEKYIPEPFEKKAVEGYKEDIIQSFEPVKETSYEQETLWGEGFLAEENVKKHRIIGQLFETYWLIEFEEKLYIIDQHAAHEKIKYEKIMAMVRNNTVTSQMVRPPYIISLSLSQEECVQSHMDDFKRMGFMLEHFGGYDYAVTAVPSELFGISVQDYLISVIDDLAANRNIKEPDAVNDRIATMSCKAAVKGNTYMTFEEADSLIGQLLALDNPYNCPHGRPTIVSFTKADIEKMFKRIV